jgi:uncharacterized membrane protein YeaQ/YmgE (transglycosylase-associated protein family)
VEVVGLIVTGGLAGWIAGTLVRGAGYGLVLNIVLGVIGGIVGGKLFALLGIVEDGSWLIRLALAVAGAVLLLALVSLARQSPSRSPRPSRPPGRRAVAGAGRAAGAAAGRRRARRSDGADVRSTGGDR